MKHALRNGIARVFGTSVQLALITVLTIFGVAGLPCAADADDSRATGLELTVDDDVCNIEEMIHTRAVDYGETSLAEAVGVLASDGDDIVTNRQGAGALLTEAICEMDAVDDRDTPVPIFATATAMGIDGGTGDDLLRNDGYMTTSAASAAETAPLFLDDSLAGETELTTRAVATATGIQGGEGADVIRTGDGSFNWTGAQARTSAANMEIEFGEPADLDTGLNATALVTGLEGGAGDDTIVAGGTIMTAADARTDVSSMSISIGEGELGEEESIRLGLGAEARADATVISGGDGADEIAVTGQLHSWANAVSRSGSGEINAVDVNVVDSRTEATSRSIGVDGGAGGDKINVGNEATISTSAYSSVSSLAMELNLVNAAPEARMDQIASAQAVGIDGADGNDVVTNGGWVMSNASANVNDVQLGLTLVDATVIPEATGSELDQEARVSGRIAAVADAAAVDAGAGNDVIVNEGVMVAHANASFAGVGIAVGAEGIPGALIEEPASLTDTAPSAVATATGIAAGDGDDRVVNSGYLYSTALAQADAVSVELSLPILEPAVDVPSPAFAVGNAATTAESSAAGIAGEEGADELLNGGDIRAEASSRADAVSVSVALQGLTDGIVLADLQAAMTESGTLARAESLGMGGGAGDDVVTNAGSIESRALANVEGTSVSIGIQGDIDKAVNLGGALAQSDTQADAVSRGLAGDAGNDEITSAGPVTSAAEAHAETVGVSLEAQLAIQDAASGAGALVNLSTLANADAVALDGGDGNDTIETVGLLTTTAMADAHSTAVSITAQNMDRSLSMGMSLAKGETTADSRAVGLDAGAGDDTIDSHADLYTSGVSIAHSDSVSLTVQAGMTGGEAGLALADTATVARSEAAGLSAGSGNDGIRNTGEVKTDAFSAARSDSVSMTLQLVDKGMAAGAALAEGATEATAAAAGLDAGDGDDVVENLGDVGVTAGAGSFAGSVALDLQLAGEGLGVAAALSDASTIARATTSAIDAGAGADVIVNVGDLETGSYAQAHASSVAVGIQGGGTALLGGATLANTETLAVAETVAIDGGLGDDEIENKGDIDASSNSYAISESVSAKVAGVGEGATLGAAVADGRTTSVSTSTAISGGDGDDRIANLGRVRVDATSRSWAEALAVDLEAAGSGMVAGFTVADGTASADSTAVGIDGGGGDDEIDNRQEVEVTADATSRSDSIAITVHGSAEGVTLGAALATADNRAVASATGLSGGEGDDVMTNRGEMTSHAVADAETVSVAVDAELALVGVGVSAAEAATLAEARSAGMDGGGGSDVMTNTTLLQVDAVAGAETDSVSVSAALGSAAFADASSTARARATGMGGGDGNDQVENSGEIEFSAGAEVDAFAAGAELLGYASADAAATAESFASGLDGGSGDDTLTNTGSLHGVTSSVAESGSVAVNLGGALEADASTTAFTRATGMDGGEGRDTVTNEGAIELDVTARADSLGVSAQLLGGAFADVGTTSEAHATGMDGGGGDDVIVVTEPGVVVVSAQALTTVETAAVNLVGLAAGDADSVARTEAGGLAGGAGNDAIRNDGFVEVNASTEMDAYGATVTLAGVADSSARTVAETSAFGIDAGEDNDTVLNTGTLLVFADSELWSAGVSASLVGAGSWNASLIAMTDAVGVRGGDGSDVLGNEGTLLVVSDASLRSESGSGVLFGQSGAETDSGATSTATGIDGGAADDKIDNTGDIEVHADAELELYSGSFTLGGVADASGELSAVTEARGMAGGSGADEIINAGRVIVDASSELFSSSDSTVMFGQAESAGVSGARTLAVGIDAGEDDDKVANKGTIDVHATSELTVDGSSYTLGGTAEQGSSLAAHAGATGIEAGSGNDKVVSRGAVTVTAESELDLAGEVATTFGTAQGQATTLAAAEATGISGSAGDDSLENAAALDVNALTEVKAHKAAFVFAGEAEADTALSAISRAMGLAGGDGADQLVNSGDLRLSSAAFIESVGGARSTFGGTATAGDVLADSAAIGMSGGAGDDRMDNSGAMFVEGLSEAIATNTASAGWIVGDGDTASISRTVATGTGIAGGAGENEITNSGDLVVSIEGSSYAFAQAEGAHFSWDGDGQAIARSDVDVTAMGISVLDGNNEITNSGTIRVSAGGTTMKTVTTTVYGCWPDPDNAEEVICEERIEELVQEPTLAVANGNGVTGTGNALAEASVRTTAVGIHAGDGDNTIVNSNEIFVEANAEACARTVADGDWEGDAIGRTRVDAAARAVGIEVGTGHNSILNNEDSLIVVTATPTGQATTEVTGGDVCIWFFGWWCGGGGDGYVVLEATLDAEAVGVRAGDGSNEIVNDGTIQVVAAPVAEGDILIAAGDSTPSMSLSSSSRAVGIEAGDGSNRIVNTGTIEVNAYGLEVAPDTPEPRQDGSSLGEATVEAAGIVTGAGNDKVENRGTIEVTAHAAEMSTASATGIATGDGDDRIVNAGTVMASREANGVVDLGLAIDSGAGADRVVLEEGSMTQGHVMLGLGDDTLVFRGDAAVAGFEGLTGDPLISGGDGWDSLVLEGVGVCTFTDMPDSMEHIRLNSDVMEVRMDSANREGDECALMEGGLLEATLNENGHSGQFRVDGGDARLAGTLELHAATWAYQDGQTFDVVRATHVNELFDEIVLPEETAFLEFDAGYLEDCVRVEVDVASFASAAHNPVEHAVAGALDAIAPVAAGDMSRLVGSFQLASRDQVGRGFATLSPGSYDNLTRASLDTTRLQMETMNQRLDMARNTARQWEPGMQPVGPRYNNRTNPTTVFEAGDGFWISGLGQDGDQDPSDGFAGHSYDTTGSIGGYEWARGSGLLGAAVGFSQTDVDLDGGLAVGAIDSVIGSVYGSYIWQRTFLTAVASYADNDYENRRIVSVGELSSGAAAKYNGDSSSLLVKGGTRFRSGRWMFEPYLSARYIYLDQAGFAESGPSSANLLVQSRTTDSLTSDLGMRFARDFRRGDARFIPELVVGWNHDYGIDDRALVAAFSDAPLVPIAFEGQKFDVDSLNLGVGFAYQGASGLNASFRYNLWDRGDYRTDGLIANLGFKF